MIDLIPGIQASTAALEAERTRLDVIAQNIANVHTTHAANGKPYQRQEVVFETALSHAVNGQPQEVIPRVARIEKDSRPPISVYMPGNPDADAHGMVAMPNMRSFQRCVC